MDRICRLCLAVVADRLVLKLALESEIILCLRWELSFTEDFPRQVCTDCHNKIQEIHSFYKKVTENELKLQEHFNENSLHSFYSQLTSSVEVKDEKNNLVKEESESNDFDTTYFEPYNLETNKTENEENTTYKSKNRTIDENKTHKSKRKARTKEKTTTLTRKDKQERSPNLKKGVIKNGKTSEHDPNKCLTCFKLFDSSSKLSDHYKKEHSIPSNEIKPDSEIILSDKYSLHELEGQKPFYKCNSCGDSNEDVEEMIKHVVLHMYERPFLCKLCGKTYKTVYEILRHGRVHSGYKLLCQHGCGYSSPYHGAMRDHEKRHTDDRNYTCKTCGKGFLVKTWYEQHQNIHKNVKPFKCDVCGMAFHMHRENTIFARKKEYEWVNWQSKDPYLVTHRNKMHPSLSAIRKFICTQCSFTCGYKNALTKHMEEHVQDPPEPKLLCDLCGKAFSRTDHLTNHKNGTHYGIKPHSCSVCNKQFLKKFNLTVHERTHTGEGRHLCLYCGKFFAQKSTLYRHQKKRHPDEYERSKAQKLTKADL